MLKTVLASCLLMLLAIVPALARAGTVGDYVSVAGSPSNKLVGYGLVVGLNHTGDQTTQVPYTNQTIKNMLKHMGVSLPARSFLQPNDVAAVMVTATLPAFATPGQKLPVHVSAMGNASSLQGGTLLMTPLHGANGKTYAIAQGPLAVSGIGAGGGGQRSSTNTPTEGSIAHGASVERTVKAKSPLSRKGIRLTLDKPSYAMASRIARAINHHFSEDIAKAPNNAYVTVLSHHGGHPRAGFVAAVKSIPVNAPKPPAEVVIDSGSGTIVMGGNIKISPCAIAYGGLSIKVSSQPVISQPAPFSKGKTTPARATRVKAKQKKAHILPMLKKPTLSKLVNALNAVGAKPSDLVGIIRAMKAAGALHAKIKVI